MNNTATHIQTKLTEYMQGLDQRGYFHGAVLVAAEGEALICKGFGLANHSHLIPNTSTTKFRIGSLTKGFTAAAIMQLEERGLLRVEDFIGVYLPDYPHGNQITIHHLLTHTSGIPNYAATLDFWETSMRLKHTLAQAIDLFRDKPLDFQPGESWSYSNSGYLLLTAIIEKVSGLAYADYLRQNILLPLGMNDSGCDDGRPILRNAASGYSVWESYIHPEFEDLALALGAYGLYSTVEDLYRWDQALYTDQLLTQASREKMFTAYMPIYGGYGWHISQPEIGGNKRARISHLGDVSGFHNHIARFVEDQVTVIVLSNVGLTPVEQISMDLAKIALGESVEPLKVATVVPLTTEQMASLAGNYLEAVQGGSQENAQEAAKDQVKAILSVEADGKLYLASAKRYGAWYKYPVIPVKKEGESLVLTTEVVDEVLEFRLDEHNQPKELIYRDLYREENVLKRK
ncbi:serine hydrolase domain-containing protein [Brevibacillus ginsengisoli]|uniref:serine hydrolase domain-containing protein n=1 Tax=Brevibacillus ginsengisoli TaxID=363854 RepID=UPI003CE6EADB